MNYRYQILTILSLILLSFFISCNDARKNDLLEIQSLIEVYPDSALMILESIDVDGETQENKALYDLLLTQARYKNYIDETDDTRIREATNFFLSNGDVKNGGMGLFLIGIIQYNMDKLGDAAVCFKKGMELSRQYGLNHIEGLCARGLYKLYVKLYDGVQQIKYAKASYEAFLKEDKEWANYARLDLATAYNNNGQYARAISEAIELIEIAKSISDTVLLAESISLMALSQFAIGDKVESVRNYVIASALDGTLLTDNDKHNILIAVDDIDKDSVPIGAYDIIAEFRTNENFNIPFELLAKQERYKEAYIDLEKYKIEQDKILSSLLKSTVSEALFSYDQSQILLHKEKRKSERLLWVLIFVAIVFLCASVVYFLRKRLQAEKNHHESMIMDAECLKADLLRQIDENKLVSASLKAIFRQKYSVVDKLCTAYYESQGIRLEKKRIVSEVEQIIKEFSNDATRLRELEEYADNHAESICSSFKEDFPNLKDDDYRLFLYLLLGFSARSVSLFFNEKIEVIYNRKSRLKSKIKSSSVAMKDKYMTLFV